MKMTSRLTVWGMLVTLAAASVSPALADGYQSQADQQKNKNNMRNLGYAGAAVAAFGLLNHNNTLTLLGAAGAALAGSQYEKDRKEQSQDNSRYYYRDGRNPSNGWHQNNNWNQNNSWRQNNNWHPANTTNWNPNNNTQWNQSCPENSYRPEHR